MSFPNFKDIKLLSNIEISNNIIQIEKDLFDLNFKKATRQPIKSHQIKYAKRKLAQLKTLLTLRLNKEKGVVNLVQKQNYLTQNS
jgi:large subunit ribosomal protein L29